MTPAHHPFGASRSHIWLNCAASIRLSEGVADTASAYAQEGTAKHSAIEECRSKGVSCGELNPQDSRWSAYWGAEFRDSVVAHLDFVSGFDYDRREVETRLSLAPLIEGGFGTADEVHISGTLARIVDFKGGAGVRVSPVWNSQLLLYAYGVDQEFGWLHDFDTFELCVSQPALENFECWKISRADLLRWTEEVVKPALIAASAPDSQATAGDHCRWCLAASRCEARVQHFVNADFPSELPELMTGDRLGEVLHLIRPLKAWIEQVESYAKSQADAGTPPTGWVLKSREGRRVMPDTPEVLAVLHEAGLTDDTLFPRKMVGITTIEKALGKRHPALQLAQRTAPTTILAPVGATEAVTDFDGSN